LPHRDGSRYGRPELGCCARWISLSSEAETAPNSYTGSGPCLFPDNDGFPANKIRNQAVIAGRPGRFTRHFFSRGRGGGIAPQKPLRARCRPGKPASSIRPLGPRCRHRLSGERKVRERGVSVTLPAPRFSAASRAAQGVGDGDEQRIGSVSWRLCIWAASARLRQFKLAGTLHAPWGASCRLVPAGSESYPTSAATFRAKPRATTPGPIQPGEVELTTQVDRAGSMSQNKIHKMRSLLDASVRPYSSRRRAEVDSTAIVHRLSPL
jgi:hypothetical protein